MEIEKWKFEIEMEMEIEEIEKWKSEIEMEMEIEEIEKWKLEIEMEIKNGNRNGNRKNGNLEIEKLISKSDMPISVIKSFELLSAL